MATMNKMKSLWKKSGLGLKLKVFVRELADSGKEGCEEAKAWFANKAQATQKAAKAARLVNKGKLLAEIRQASKNARGA